MTAKEGTGACALLSRANQGSGPAATDGLTAGNAGGARLANLKFLASPGSGPDFVLARVSAPTPPSWVLITGRIDRQQDRQQL